MAVVHNNLPGDPVLIDKIVYELKSQGIFDQFRKECIADVDTKPAYQNLRQRVEGSVTGFLSKQKWSSDMNKNQVREMLRKNIYESGFLETGVERIVDQVVNPKMNSVFLPKVTEVVYQFLGIEKPSNEQKENLKLTFDNENLLPTDLEAVSPESEKKFDIGNHLLNLDDSKIDEDESPPFEPLEEKPVCIPPEDNSVDSHLSGISGLMSHDSNHSQEFSKPIQMEISNQDSALSKQSSEGRLSIVMSDDNETKMEVCEELTPKTPKMNDVKPKEFELNAETSNSSPKKVEIKSEDKSKRSKNHDKHRSRHDSKKNDKDKRSDKDRKEHRDKHSSSRDKAKEKDRKDSKSSSSKSTKDKSEKSSDNNKSDKDKSKSSSNRHGSSSSSSGKDKEKSSSSSKKESSAKDRGDNKDKSKLSSSSTNVSKDKDSKHRDSSSKSKGDSKSSSSKHDSSKSDRHKKEDKHRSDRHSSSSRSRDKDRKDSKKDKKESKDDHFSSKKKPDRRSTDRDSNDGQSGLKSSSSSFDSSSASSQTQKQSQESSNSNSNNGSGDSGNSDAIEECAADNTPVTILNDKLEEGAAEVNINTEMKERIQIPHALKLIKPKFASNIHEARRLMKIRKQLALLEKQSYLDVSRILNEQKRSKCTEDGNTNKVVKNDKTSNHKIVADKNHTVEPPTKVPAPEPLSPPLKSSVVSAATWDALEAKLHESINYSTCYDVVEGPEEISVVTTVAYSKDDCLFLAPNVSDRTKRYIKCAGESIKVLQDAIDKRSVDKAAKGKRLHFSNNVSKGTKRKFSDYQSDMKNNNKKFNTHHIEVHENFSLPLSPAESDNSIDKKSDTSDSSYKSLKKTETEFTDKIKKTTRAAAKTQRYSSEDLYKPRPIFGGSRRRNGRNLGVD